MPGGSGAAERRRGRATGPAAAATRTSTAPARPLARTPDRPFTPTSITIPRVVGPTRVLALGRDRHGSPEDAAADRPGQVGVRLGQGVAHPRRQPARRGAARTRTPTPGTGPTGSRSATVCSQKLRVGATLVVAGPDGRRMCYRVARQRLRPCQAVRPRLLRLERASAGWPSWSAPACAAARATGATAPSGSPSLTSTDSPRIGPSGGATPSIPARVVHHPVISAPRS